MSVNKQSQYIVIESGSEKFGIPIEEIHEIIKVPEITEIPNSKPYIKGVINLRGKIVPIISLRTMIGMEEIGYTRSTRIIVVHFNEEEIGMVVDDVNQVSTFQEIQPSLKESGHYHRSAYLSGVGRSSDGLVSILNLEQLFQME